MQIAQLHTFLSQAKPAQSAAFVCALSQDWNVGRKLWQHLPDDLKTTLVDLRKQGKSADSGGNPSFSPRQGNNGNQQNAPETNTDTVKAPVKNPI